MVLFVAVIVEYVVKRIHVIFNFVHFLRHFFTLCWANTGSLDVCSEWVLYKCHKCSSNFGKSLAFSDLNYKQKIILFAPRTIGIDNRQVTKLCLTVEQI